MSLTQVVFAAIEANKQNRLKIGELLSGLPFQQTVQEFCTVRVDVGRRSGKSTAILELAAPQDFIIVGMPNAHYGVRDASGKLLEPECKVVRFVDVLRSSGARVVHPLTVWIDEPKLVFAQRFHRERLYGWLGERVKPQDLTIVELGKPEGYL